MIKYQAILISSNDLNGIRSLISADQIDVVFLHDSKSHFFLARYYRSGKVTAAEVRGEEEGLIFTNADGFNRVSRFSDTVFIEQVLNTVGFPASFDFEEMDVITSEEFRKFSSKASLYSRMI